MQLKYQSLADLGPFQMNCYLIYDAESRRCLVVDPGAESAFIIEQLERLNLNPMGIYCTHAHIDHVLEIGPIRKRYPVPVWMPKADAQLYAFLPNQCEIYGIPVVEPEADCLWLEEGSVLNISPEVEPGKIWLTPGHSPGSSCLLFEQAGFLVGGDTLFRQSVGRVDLWGGDGVALKASLDRLMSLPDPMAVLPGHGPLTTIGFERRQNPYIVNPQLLLES